MPLTLGRITIEGDDGQIAFVQDALSRVKNLPAPLPDLFKRDYRIIPKTPAELIALGAIIPGTVSARHSQGKAAWGFTPSAGKQWWNTRLAIRKPAAARYSQAHEIGHAIGIQYLTDAKVAELRPMLGPRTAYGKYANSFSEAYADAFAEACGFFDPLDDFYRDFPDEALDDLIAITFRPDPAPPIVLPPPVVLPLPDPALVAALHRAEAAEEENTRLRVGIATAQNVLGAL